MSSGNLAPHDANFASIHFLLGAVDISDTLAQIKLSVYPSKASAHKSKSMSKIEMQIPKRRNNGETDTIEIKIIEYERVKFLPSLHLTPSSWTSDVFSRWLRLARLNPRTRPFVYKLPQISIALDMRVL